MPLPSLPPRYSSFPTRMLFESQLPPAVLVTWLQLASLTWCGQESHTFDVQEWVDYTATSRTSFNRHLRLLHSRHLLRRDFPQPGMVHVSFEGVELIYRPPLPRLATKAVAKNPPSPAKAGLSPLTSSASDRKYTGLVDQPGLVSGKVSPGLDEIDELELKNSKSKMVPPKLVESKMVRPFLVPPPSLNPPSSFSLIPDSESGFQELKQEINAEEEGRGEGVLGERVADPSEIYRQLARLSPSAAQRRILSTAVSDHRLWQASVEHWLMHGWNPLNLPGMLELYQRGGPVGCRRCQRPASPPPGKAHHQQSALPLDQTRSAIQELRSKQSQPVSHE